MDRIEMQGVYLAALKLPNGDFLLEIGQSATIRSRAGRLAANALRTASIEVEWAEVMYVIETDDEEDRLELERIVLSEAAPIYGNEYFRGEDFDRFTTVVWMGAPYTERTTSYDRRHQFFQYLAKMDGLET